MVNALCRREPGTAVQRFIKEQINYKITNTRMPSGKNMFPSALREFINSNADLPTIDELVQKSRQLAVAMGMLD